MKPSGFSASSCVVSFRFRPVKRSGEKYPRVLAWRCSVISRGRRDSVEEFLIEEVVGLLEGFVFGGRDTRIHVSIVTNVPRSQRNVDSRAQSPAQRGRIISPMPGKIGL